MLDLPTPASHALDPDSGLWVPRRRGLCSISSGIAGAAAMQGARRSRTGGVTYLTDWSTDLTFTRASEAAAVDPRDGSFYDLVTPWPGSNVARILDDGALLIEGPRTNQLTYSDAGSFAATVGTPTATTGQTGPDGLSTATLLGDDSAAAVEMKRHGFVPTGAQTITGYVLRSTATSVPAIGHASTEAFPQFVHLDSSDGSVSAESGSSNVDVAGVWNAGDGWDRLRATIGTTVGNHWYAAGARASTVGGAEAAAATGAARFALMQVEAALFPSTPMRTAGSTATRASERAVVAAASVPSALLTGAWELDFWPMFSSGDAGTHHLLLFSASRRLTVTSGVVTLQNAGGTDAVSSLTWSERDKLTIGADFGGNLSVRVNDGGASTTALSGDWSDATGDLDVGSGGAGAGHAFGVISRLRAA